MTKKILTYKSGQFSFIDVYDESSLISLLVEADILYQTVRDLPILPELASQLNEEVIIRAVFGTAAIEGSPLNEDEVKSIIQSNRPPADMKRTEKEIRNLKLTYSYISGCEAEGKPYLIDEGTIKKIHSMITDDLDYQDNSPGQYRNHIVKVGDDRHGGIYTPPKIIEDIRKLMAEFIGWMNSPEIMSINPVLRAALAHYHLGLIHPFGNGNGRTARAIEALMLRKAGFKYVSVMLSNYYYNKLDEYFQVFRKSEKDKDGKVTDFLGFVLEGFIFSLREIKDKIIFYIRKFTLRDYFIFIKESKIISRRQFDLLNLLLTYMVRFDIKDLSRPPMNMLYGKTSERTAQRDIKKLLDHNLLVLRDEKFELNLQVIG